MQAQKEEDGGGVVAVLLRRKKDRAGLPLDISRLNRYSRRAFFGFGGCGGGVDSCHWAGASCHSLFRPLDQPTEYGGADDAKTR